MGGVVELLDVEGVLLKFNDGPFVVIHVAVVGRRKYRDYGRKLLRPIPLMHFVPVKLRLMRSQN